ncbi:Daunorubicin/doxorubicin resistance ATP-binding protein DrrA [Clavibacter michiganensis]|uniref:Daunorubicin/doxorubicin resistance ATP-binding protein DrrA n=1 Tax=Clavibacter michiganensis TaxID=28447 RepID=A0A251YB29_9MICO|nr:ATP-binding cassette domain-containing protein [Clavibacter michiganensis]OUE21303.1 Daunorubicin/doxorubicin resistance ATP-binding protein DrrA [Clavibacter michiganensis]
MTDAPDETTSPDATSDSATEPRDHADRAPSDVAEEPTAGPAAADDERATTTAVPRPPRPGQRVPRRATAPSPRTAPAVVVAPTPPRVKSTPVTAPASRPSGAAADGDGEAPSTTARPPRVRRRTRVQRAAGSAEGVPAAPEASGASEAPSDPVPVAEDDSAATQPPQDGLSELGAMFVESDPEASVEPARSDAADQDDAPTDDGPAADPEGASPASAEEVGQGVAGVADGGEAEDAPDADADADADAGADADGDADEPVADEPVADADPAAEPERDTTSDLETTPADPPAAGSDAVADEENAVDPAQVPVTEDGEDAADGEADTDTTVAAEQVAGMAPAAPRVPPGRDEDASASHADPAAARAVTVRTDSLTAPRSSRPGLAGMAETALTPSVRGDRAAAPELGEDVLVIDGLTKRFDEKVAVDDVALTVRAGSFYGIVGPNGAGKTTTMSMVTGLLRPDAGTVTVNGIDVWREPLTAKRSIGVLPDRLRLFDRLTGAQLLHYSGALRGLDDAEIRSRSADLIAAFGLEDAVGRLVTDYSAGMTKKVALACAMIHSPRMLVLDEPFESVDPVSAANVVEILQDYVAHGGTVVLSSHGMDFIQRICDHVAIIVNGRVLAAGTMDEVRAGRSLEERFVALAGGRRTAEGFSWLHSFSD